MYEFGIKTPASVDDVKTALGESDDGQFLAGGQTLIPVLKQRLAIGDPHVRNRGTIGGSVANNDPAADYPAAVLGLGATVVTNEREIDADNFFTGMFDTALNEGELITEIVFPIPEAAGYIKFPNPATRYALVGVMVAKFGNTVRVAVTGAGPCAFRVAEMEQALTGNFSPDSIKDGLVPAGSQTDSGVNFFSAFANGNVGIAPSGSFAIGALNNNFPDLNYGVAYLPGQEEGQISSFAGGDNIVISAGTTAAEFDTNTLVILRNVTTMTWPVFFDEVLTAADGVYAGFAALIAGALSLRRLDRREFQAVRLWEESRRGD